MSADKGEIREAQNAATCKHGLSEVCRGNERGTGPAVRKREGKPPVDQDAIETRGKGLRNGWGSEEVDS